MLRADRADAVEQEVSILPEHVGNAGDGDLVVIHQHPLIASQPSIGVVVARVHGPLMDNHGRQIEDILRCVDTLLVLLDGVGEHVQGHREVDVAVHLLRGRRGVLVALKFKS